MRIHVSYNIKCVYVFRFPRGVSRHHRPYHPTPRETAVKLFHRKKIKKERKKRVGRNTRRILCIHSVYCTYIIIIIYIYVNARVCVWRTVVGGGHVEPGQRDFYPSHSAHSPNSCTRLGSIPLYIILYTLRTRSCIRALTRPQPGTPSSAL